MANIKLEIYNHGWAELNIGTFTGYLSYIENVPQLFLNFILDYLTDNKAVETFDSEGYDFTLIFTNGTAYTIDYDTKKEKTVLLTKDKLNATPEDIIPVILDSIRNNLDYWAGFAAENDSPEKINQCKERLTTTMQAIDLIRNN